MKQARQPPTKRKPQPELHLGTITTGSGRDPYSIEVISEAQAKILGIQATKAATTDQSPKAQ